MTIVVGEKKVFEIFKNSFVLTYSIFCKIRAFASPCTTVSRYGRVQYGDGIWIFKKEIFFKDTKQTKLKKI